MDNDKLSRGDGDDKKKKKPEQKSEFSSIFSEAVGVKEPVDKKQNGKPQTNNEFNAIFQESLKKKVGGEEPPVVSPDSSKDSSNGSPSPSQSGLGLAEMISKSIQKPTLGSRFRTRARREEAANAPLKTTPSGDILPEPTTASGAAGEDVKQNEISDENPFKERIQAEEYIKQRLAEQKSKLRNKPEAAANEAEALFRKPEDINDRPLDEFDLNDIGSSLEGKRDEQAFQVYQKDRNEKDAVSKFGITEEGALNFAASQGDKDAINVKQQPLVSRKKFDEVVGTKMMEYLYSPNVMKMASENPELAKQWDERNEKLYEDYPSLAKRIVAQKIGQEREDRGMGGLLVDIPTKKGLGQFGSFKTEGGRGGGDNTGGEEGGVDGLVEDMHSKGDLSDKEVEIYNNELRPKLGVGRSIGRGIGNIFAPAFTNDAPIPTTDFAGTLGESYKNTIRSIAHSVEDIVNPIKFDEKTRVNDIMNREYSTAMIEPKGFLSQAASTGGHLTGFLIPMIIGGEAKIPEVISSGLTFGGINHDAALRMFPDNKQKQLAYTAIATAGDMWLTKLLPTKEAGEGLRKSLGGEIKKAIEDFADNKLTAQAAKERLIDKATSLIQKVAPDLIKGNTKTAATLSGFGLFHNGLDAAFGGRNVTFDEAANEAVQTFKIGLLAATPLTAAGMYGKYDKSTAKSLREAANNKDFYNKMIYDQIYLDPNSIQPKLEALANLERASAVNEDLKSSNLSEKQKDKYLLHDVVESIWTRKAESTTDTNLKEQYLQKAEDAKSIKDQIWKGTKDEDIIPDSHKEFLEQKDKIEKEIISLETDHDFEQQKLGLKLSALKKETDLDEEGKKKNDIEQQQVQQKMQELADKHDIKVNKLKEERSALVKERNSTLSPDDIVGRIKQAATSSIAKGFKGDEKVEEQMTAQSIDAPFATMDSLSGDRELVTDLIAKNSKEDIEAARKKWMKVDDEKADDNIKLLEEGLEKQKTKNENDTQAAIQNLSATNKKEGTQTPEEKDYENKKADIERRRQEAHKALQEHPLSIGINGNYHLPEMIEVSKGGVSKSKEPSSTKEINEKYDAELAELEKQNAAAKSSPVPEGGRPSTVSVWQVGDVIPADQQRPEKKIKSIGGDIGQSMVRVEFEDGTKGAIPKDKNAYLNQLSGENKTDTTPEDTPSSLKDLYDKYDNGDIGSFGDLVEQVESYAKENGNENLLTAIDKYRREQEYDRSISGRGDWDAMEKELTDVIESEIKKQKSVPEGGGEVKGMAKPPITVIKPEQGPPKNVTTEKGVTVERPKNLSPEKTKAFTEKMRSLADRIEKDGLDSVYPKWMKADFPEGTQVQGKGFGGKALDKVVAEAIRVVAKVIDETADLTQAIEQGFSKLKEYYTKNTKSFDETKLKTDFSAAMNTMFEESVQKGEAQGEKPRIKTGGQRTDTETGKKLTDESGSEYEKEGGFANFLQNKDISTTGDVAEYLSKPTIEVSGKEITQPFDYNKTDLDLMIEDGKRWVTEAKLRWNGNAADYATNMIDAIKNLKNKMAVKAVSMVNLLNSIDNDLSYKNLTVGERDRLINSRHQLEKMIAEGAREGSLTLNAQRLIHKLYKGEYKFTDKMEEIVTKPVQKTADAVIEKLKQPGTEISETVRKQQRKKANEPESTKEEKVTTPKKETVKQKKTSFYSKALEGTSKENISKLKQQIKDLAAKIKCP